ncbi:hypothetical protein OG520_40495 (plasmid) [Streptomyces sp. NBC_00984]|uniref:hypothetical protein n=1 Tax=Streptomyces sp. NBC_00984 TaxID=2903700 RepID=UPI00386D54EE|nr:hypothetical protein OG520_40495 [Streptomyces sp. NBC_00984]
MDDWIETGSQAGAVKEIVIECGGGWAGCAVIVDQLDEEALRAKVGPVRGLLFAKELVGLVKSSLLVSTHFQGGRWRLVMLPILAQPSSPQSCTTSMTEACSAPGSSAASSTSIDTLRDLQ